MRYLLLLFLLSSCGHPHDRTIPASLNYCLFQHVKEITNSSGEFLLKYDVIEKPLNSTERDTLIQILKEQHESYKITLDGQVLIPQTKLVNMDRMSALDVELYNRLRKKMI